MIHTLLLIFLSIYTTDAESLPSVARRRRLLSWTWTNSTRQKTNEESIVSARISAKRHGNIFLLKVLLKCVCYAKWNIWSLASEIYPSLNVSSIIIVNDRMRPAW